MRAVPLNTPGWRFETVDVQLSHVVFEFCHAIQLDIVALYNSIWLLWRFPRDGHKAEAAYIVIAASNNEILRRTGHW